MPRSPAGSLAYLVTDWIKGEYNLPEVDLLDWVRSVTRQPRPRMLRNHWAMGEKPVGNMIKLLESKGVRVFSLAEEHERTSTPSHVGAAMKPYVFLNTFKSTERSRLTPRTSSDTSCYTSMGAHDKGRAPNLRPTPLPAPFLMPEADVVASVPYAGVSATS